MNIIKKIVVILVFLCAATVANAQDVAPATEVSPQTQALEVLKQQNTWRGINGNFSTKNAYFNVAKQGFETYFRKYSPNQVFRNEDVLVMAAKYGPHNIKCTFFKDVTQQHIVVIETDWERDKMKWLANVVKQVEKLGK